MHGAFDGGEFVSNLYQLIVDTNAIVRGIPDAMRFVECKIALHIRWVMILAMARMEGVWVDVCGNIGWH